MTNKSIEILLISCLIVILSPGCLVFAQGDICNGNLGDNLFDDGDFGSGILNILPTNPNIAPGYSYQTNTPPEDGQYLLTNSSAQWNNIHAAWLRIPDNSSDPNGYMMVVNASYSPGLFYDKVIDGLCENTLYEFSADIINFIKPGVQNHISPNVTFLIDNDVKITTGLVPQDGVWHTYGFTFSTLPGQTSVRLSLRNNAPGGIGNDLALDNITFSPCGPDAFISGGEVIRICEDGQPEELIVTIEDDVFDTPTFVWQQSFDAGLSWEEIPGVSGPIYLHTDLDAGDYYYRFLLANGHENLNNQKCRIQSDLKIIRVEPLEWEVIDTICKGASYITGTHNYTQAGIYIDTLTSSIGCDSIVTLDLRIKEDSEIELDWEVKDPSCRDQKNGVFDLINIFNAVPPLEISFGGETFNSPFKATDLKAGKYNLIVEDRYKCTYTEDIIINNPAQFEIGLGGDRELIFGDLAEIPIYSNYTIEQYEWTPPGITECISDCEVISWYPVSDVVLKLNATSQEGCKAEDSIKIKILDQRRVYIPSAFSPNGDGINDIFHVFSHIPTVSIISDLSIYDRWGNRLFNQNNIDPENLLLGWDGTTSGKQLNTGTYIYQVKVVFMDGKSQTYSGELELIR